MFEPKKQSARKVEIPLEESPPQRGREISKSSNPDVGRSKSPGKSLGRSASPGKSLIRVNEVNVSTSIPDYTERQKTLSNKSPASKSTGKPESGFGKTTKRSVSPTPNVDMKFESLSSLISKDTVSESPVGKHPTNAMAAPLETSSRKKNHEKGNRKGNFAPYSHDIEATPISPSPKFNPEDRTSATACIIS